MYKYSQKCFFALIWQYSGITNASSFSMGTPLKTKTFNVRSSNGTIRSQDAFNSQVSAFNDAIITRKLRRYRKVSAINGDATFTATGFREQFEKSSFIAIDNLFLILYNGSKQTRKGSIAPARYASHAACRCDRDAGSVLLWGSLALEAPFCFWA